MRNFTFVIALLVVLLVVVQAQQEEGIVKYQEEGRDRSNSNSNSNSNENSNESNGGSVSRRVKNLRARSRLSKTEATYLARYSMAVSRNNRSTCNASKYPKVNNGLCATHCLAKGNRGGFCNKRSVCKCN